VSSISWTGTRSLYDARGMGMELHWHHVGPPRAQSVEVPPISIGNYGYALVYDPVRDRIVYVRMAEYHRAIEAWTWDGDRWSRDEAPAADDAKVDDDCHGYFDTRRGAVIVGSMEHDRELERHVPTLLAVDASGARRLVIAGEPPVIEPEDSDKTFYPSSNVGWLAGFDEARGVGVCVTRNGIWEIENDAWVKRCKRPDAIPPEWHSSVGSAWDPIGKRCVMWLQERGNGYAMRLFSWDGSTCNAVSTDGLPDLDREPHAMFAAHPRHGIVCSAGPKGMYALAGDAWSRLPDAKDPPPLMKGRGQSAPPQLAYDPKRAAFVIGPGYHEDDPGGAEAQDVFFVLRDGAWQQQGVLAKYAEIQRLRDNQKHAVVQGTWYVTSDRDLETWRWAAEGWQQVVDEKTGEALVGRERLAAIAGGDALYAVTNQGTVFRLAGDRYEKLADGSAVFKERTELELAHDGKRLIAWGGKVNNRKQNDTLVLEGTTWVANKKTSPKPADFSPPKHEYVDFATMFDGTLGTLVRFGHQEVAVLEGPVWTPYKPAQYSTLLGARTWQHVPAHDPVTGETLVIDFEAARVVRFDLAGCAEVATLDWGPLAVDAKKFDVVLPRAYRHVFDPVTRTIQSQHLEDKWARYELDLAPAFEAAKALGPRKRVELPVEAPKKAKKK
jgi:hypothetical protein